MASVCTLAPSLSCSGGPCAQGRRVKCHVRSLDNTCVLRLRHRTLGEQEWGNCPGAVACSAPGSTKVCRQVTFASSIRLFAVR